MKIGIIGYGAVGKAVAEGFRQKEHEILVYDKIVENSLNSIEEVKQAEIIFICVPTPNSREGVDLTAVDESLEALQDYSGVIVLKSTVPPGTTDAYRTRFPQMRLAMNPEFLREASALQDFLNQDRIVIGHYSPADAAVVKQAFYGFKSEIFDTTPVVAESIKLFTNSFLATKVIFANEFKAYCDAKGIPYEEVIRGATLDKRIGSSHLHVTQEGGYGGKCFPKDVKNLLCDAEKTGIKLQLVETAKKVNKEIRKANPGEQL